MSDRRPENPERIALAVKRVRQATEGWGNQDFVEDIRLLADFASDPVTAIRVGVEEGTIEGREMNLCHVHGSVMTSRVFYKGQRICQYAFYSGQAVLKCFGYRGLFVAPVSDDGSET